MKELRGLAVEVAMLAVLVDIHANSTLPLPLPGDGNACTNVVIIIIIMIISSDMTNDAVLGNFLERNCTNIII